MIVYLYKESEDSFFDKIGKEGDKSYKKVKTYDLSSKGPVEKQWVSNDGEVVNMDDVKETIEYALSDLIAHFPKSVGEILKRKTILLTDNPYIRTMATDGTNIFVSPFYVNRLIKNPALKGKSIQAVAYVLAHEALHVIFRHTYEEQTDDVRNDHSKCNISQDCQINLYIDKALNKVYDFKGVSSVIGAIIDDVHKNKHWTSIYDDLPKDHPWLQPKPPKKTSPNFKKGFTAGYNYVMSALRKNKLIESYEI